MNSRRSSSALKATRFSVLTSPVAMRARTLAWTAMAFSVLGGLSACSSSKQDDADASSTNDTAMVDQNSADSAANDTNEKIAAKSERDIDPNFGSRRVPQIKEQPFQVEGRWMNAYYFVRSPDETWATLSSSIYGRPDRADLLAQWNSQGTLAVGRVVYYNSALHPEESGVMKVFAEDFGVALEQYEVKFGDSLSALAQEKYGHFDSWKELAALNNLSNPDLIQVGQKLIMQPAQINTQAILEQVIASSKDASSSMDNEIASNQSANAPPAVESELDQLDPSTAQVETASTDGINKDTAIMGIAALVILGLLVFLGAKRMKSRKAASSSAWDDSVNVTKLTRPKTGF